MSSEEKVMALLAEGNPATDLDDDAWSGIDAATYLATLERRSSEVKPVDKPRSLRAALIGFAVVLVAVGVVWVLRPDDQARVAGLPGPVASQPVEKANEIGDIAFVQKTYSWDGYRDSYGAEIPLVDGAQVFSVPSAGGEPSLLAEVPGWDGIPRRDDWDDVWSAIEWEGPGVEWSPDGSRIAFGLNGAASGIYVMNRDGSGLTRLTDVSGCGSDGWVPSICGLAWSPDGSRLAFVSPEPSTALFFVDTQDGNLTMFAESNADGRPTPPIVWSPDGTLLAFARSRGPLRGATHGLHVIKADGTEERRLVEMYRADLYGYGWSPDGSRIAFMRSDGAGPGEVSSRDDLGGLYLINADGSGLRKVSETGASFTEVIAVHQGPLDWSPDGNLIAVPADPIGAVGDGGGIALVSADGSGERVFGAGVFIDHYSFSPDWSQIVFSDHGGMASEDPPTWDPPSIYVMNTDGTGLRWLADGEYPDWSN